jgi:hypothetical protein
MALAQQTVAQMRAKETRSSSDQDAHEADIVAERSPSWPAKRTTLTEAGRVYDRAASPAS